MKEMSDRAHELKNVEKNHIDGPLGVRGRNSNNDVIREKLGWDYSQSLEEGISSTYNWIQEQLGGAQKVPGVDVSDEYPGLYPESIT